MVKLGIIIVFVLSFFALARLTSVLDFLAFSLLLSSWISSGIIVPLSIILSSLFDISSQFQTNNLAIAQNIIGKNVKKQKQSEIKSCLPIRCEVGNMYYMEAKAKLRLLQHAVSGIVFLLVNVRV